MIINRFRRGGDGTTPYQEIMGKTCKMETVAFGERIWYMRKEKNSGKNATNWKKEHG